MTTLELTEDQVLYFRARRGHLAGEGAAGATAAARAVLGIQAQQIEPALLALSQRTAGRPTAAQLQEQLFEADPRALVRTWGQRDTVHIYDAERHWARIVAAREQWAPPARQGPLPDDEALDSALDAIHAQGAVTRKDLYDVTPDGYTEEIAERARSVRQEPIHFAAGRLLWKLTHRGDLSLVAKRGSEQLYAPRRAQFPKLAWPPELEDPTLANAELTRDYLAVYGPATATDVAHFFGARVTAARQWVKVLTRQKDLIDVTCGDRQGLLALAADADDLRTPAPEDETGWPVRLLAKYDTMLMGHKDKTWTVPEEADRPQIWRKAANVLSTVLWRGRLVAVWTFKKRRRDLILTIEPLSGWHRGLLPAVEREAQEVARHLKRDSADVRVEKG